MRLFLLGGFRNRDKRMAQDAQSRQDAQTEYAATGEDEETRKLRRYGLALSDDVPELSDDLPKKSAMADEDDEGKFVSILFFLVVSIGVAGFATTRGASDDTAAAIGLGAAIIAPYVVLVVAFVFLLVFGLFAKLLAKTGINTLVFGLITRTGIDTVARRLVLWSHLPRRQTRSESRLREEMEERVKHHKETGEWRP